MTEENGTKVGLNFTTEGDYYVCSLRQMSGPAGSFKGDGLEVCKIHLSFLHNQDEIRRFVEYCADVMNRKIEELTGEKTSPDKIRSIVGDEVDEAPFEEGLDRFLSKMTSKMTN